MCIPVHNDDVFSSPTFSSVDDKLQVVWLERERGTKRDHKHYDHDICLYQEYTNTHYPLPAGICFHFGQPWVWVSCLRKEEGTPISVPPARMLRESCRGSQKHNIMQLSQKMPTAVRGLQLYHAVLPLREDAARLFVQPPVFHRGHRCRWHTGPRSSGSGWEDKEKRKEFEYAIFFQLFPAVETNVLWWYDSSLRLDYICVVLLY